jgi:DNA repair exonuclease SbcCD ATPase subunit
MTARQPLREEVLDQYEEWRRHVEELQQAQAALASIQEQSAEEARHRAELEREHREKVEQAAYRGDIVPVDLPPASVGLANALMIAQDRVMAVSSDQARVLAALADRVEADLVKEYADAEKAAQAAIAKIDEVRDRVGEMLRLATEVRTAVAAQGPRREPSRATLTRAAVTSGELVELVKQGVRVIDPEPTLGLHGDFNKIVIDRGNEGEGYRHVRHPIPQRGLNV